MLRPENNPSKGGTTQNYSVRGEIARGGMGSILEAQDRKLGRTVAMKVMLLEYDATDEEHQRFIREASVLAQLAHPNIVPIYDMGQDAEGQWFYTMKLVKGSTLQAIINDLRDGRAETVAQFTLDRLLTIFRKVCDAMAFAHAQGIIHRDLKPANIMVGEFGEVLVMDWGLAKFIRNQPPSATPPDPLKMAPIVSGRVTGGLTRLLQQRLPGGDMSSMDQGDPASLKSLDESTVQNASGAAKSTDPMIPGDDPALASGLRTMDGAVIGTPQYMSPEQAVGHIAEMDERSDQFSLGGILYAMLTLRPPVEGNTLYEVLNKVITGNITPPSVYNDPKSAVHQVAPQNGRVPDPAKIKRLPHCPGGKVPVALSAVAMKALSLAKEKRYLSVAALGEDVEAHQGGFATAAEGAGTLRQIWLLMLRHRVVSALLALIAITSACFMVALAGSAQKSRADARRISEANQSNLRNLHQASMADLASARQLLLRDVKAETVDEQPVGFSGRSFWHEGVALLVRSLERDSSNATAAFWLYDAIRRRGHEKRDWPLRIYDAKSAGFSPDGSRLATVGNDKTVRVWDAASGQAIGQAIRTNYPTETATFSPDGARIITVNARQTQLWDVASGKAIGKPIGSKIAMAGFSADGSRIVTASWDMSAQVWDAASGEPIGQPMRHQGFILSASFSPGGTRIVTSGWDKTAQVWDAATGQAISQPVHHQDNVNSANFSPDGTRIVTASQDKTAQVWDAASGQPIGQPMHHQRSVIAASFSPDGARIVTASWDGVAQIWDASTGKPVGPPMNHQGPLSGATFNADGTRIVTASEDRSAQIWDAATGQAIGQPMRHQGKVTGAAFSANGAQVLTVGDDKIAQVWDAAIGQFGGLPLPHDAAVTCAGFNFDGARIVTASGDKTAQVWDAATGQPIGQPMRHQGTVTSATFSPDGNRIVTASEDGTAQVWDAASGQPIGQPMHHHGKVSAAAFSPQGGMIVTASEDKSAQIWDAGTGQAVGPPMRHPQKVSTACFSPDGTRIATVSEDKAARVWDIASGQTIGEPMHHGEYLTTVCFSPDGARILTASWDKTAQVWDAATGQPIGKPMRHQDFVTSARFSSDGAKTLTASWDKTAKVWDAATGKLIGQPMLHQNNVSNASFSRDDTRIVTVCWDKTAQLWDAASGQPVGQPMRHSNLATTASFNPAGDKIVTTNWGGAMVWEVPKAADAASVAQIDDAALAWARSVAGLRYEADGELKVIPATDRIESLTHPAGSGAWADLARWLAASGTQCTPDVKCSTTFREIAERESAHAGNSAVASLEFALRFDPTLPLVRLMLAGALEKSDAAKAADERDRNLPQRAAFLRSYDLNRLPDDAALWARAATLLSEQQQGALALSAARKAITLDPNLPAAVEAMRSLSRPR